MTNEQLYQTAFAGLCDALTKFYGDGENSENIIGTAKKMVSAPWGWEKVFDTYIVAYAEISYHAQQEIFKKSVGKAAPAIKRIINNVPEARTGFKGWWKDAEGRACICDGVRAVRLNSGEVKGIDELPTPSIDLDRSMSSKQNTKDLELPTIQELKAFIAEQKAIGAWTKYKSVSYDFGENLPAVNPEYLIDILQILPDAKARIVPGNMSAAIYFEGSDGDAILLPMHKKASKAA